MDDSDGPDGNDSGDESQENPNDYPGYKSKNRKNNYIFMNLSVIKEVMTLQHLKIYQFQAKSKIYSNILTDINLRILN